MKRFVLPFIMVVTLFLLASCASEEYKKGSTIIKETTKKVNAAKDCESLDDAMDIYYEWYYADPISTTTAKEDIKLDKQEKELKKLYEAREKELCGKEYEDEIIEDEIMEEEED